MHRNSRASLWKRGLQHRPEMVFTGLDWHEEITSAVDGAHPLSVNSEIASEVAVRDEAPCHLPAWIPDVAIRRTSLRISHPAVRSLFPLQISPSYLGRAHSTTVERSRRWSS